MRLSLVTVVILSALIAPSAVGAGERAPQRATACSEPHMWDYNGQPALRYTLTRSYLRVAEPLGTMRHYLSCQDVLCGGPFCPPPQPIRFEEFRVFRLRGISPQVAVSLGGSSRRLLMRYGVCGITSGSLTPERAVLRCLRTAA